MSARRWLTGVAVAVSSGVEILFAAPPLITGDVPTADSGTCEIYSGVLYQDGGAIRRELPHVEIVYGIAGRWEISIEANAISTNENHGLGDLTLATKHVLRPIGPGFPGLAASCEIKLANGDAERGLGSGGQEVDLRLRAQKTLGPAVCIVNLGFVMADDVEISGVMADRRNFVRCGFAQEWTMREGLALLSEVYWRGSEEPRGSARFGWNLGFKQRVGEGVSWHGSIGESLRAGNRGGPDLRVYAGMKIELNTRR